MLSITIPKNEYWDSRNEIFITVPETKLSLEHSLVAISKWESKWQKPFLGKNDKSDEELRDYIRCMTITQNVDPNVYYFITKKNYDDILAYINSPMTATTFGKNTPGPKKKEIITSELIYYWMISNNIPFECQKWHINRLLTLIRICGIKNTPSKKMKRSDILRQNASLNEARRRAMHTSG